MRRLTHSARCAAALAALALPLLANAQADDGACILAGRLNDEGRWAPRFMNVQLLGEGGRATAAPDKSSLAAVRQARLARPALLSRCNGEQPLARADEESAGAKTAVPAVSAGLVEVESVAFPKLRTGGELVELRVRYAPERVVSIRR